MDLNLIKEALEFRNSHRHILAEFESYFEKVYWQTLEEEFENGNSKENHIPYAEGRNRVSSPENNSRLLQPQIFE